MMNRIYKQFILCAALIAGSFTIAGIAQADGNCDPQSQPPMTYLATCTDSNGNSVGAIYSAPSQAQADLECQQNCKSECKDLPQQRPFISMHCPSKNNPASFYKPVNQAKNTQLSFYKPVH